MLLLTLPQASEQLDIVLKKHLNESLEEFTQKQLNGKLLFVQINYAYERIKILLKDIEKEFKKVYKQYIVGRNNK